MLDQTDSNAAAFDSVRDDVFSRIASRYDVSCDLFSLGLHRTPKRRMVRRIAAEKWQNMLDVPRAPATLRCASSAISAV